MTLFGRRFWLSCCTTVLCAATSAAQDTRSAGTVAADAITIDAESMSRFFGRYAVIGKGQAKALMNDSGRLVVPFNKYSFLEEVVSNYGTGMIGRNFYNDSFHGAMAQFQRREKAVRLIPFLEITSNREGYLTMAGDVVFRRSRLWDEGRSPDPFWLRGYDDQGYRDNFDAYSRMTTDDGVLRFERYDGNMIVGSGNYRRISVRGGGENINFSLAQYSAEDRSVTRSESMTESIWTNGLTPATAVAPRPRGPRGPETRDPALIRAAQNTAVGFINRKGEFQVKPNFYSVSQFSEGMSFVSKIDEFGALRWGAIDTLGALVIPYKFRMHPGRFSNGLSIIRSSEEDTVRYAFINKKGDIVFTLPVNKGDTVLVQLGLKNEFSDQEYPRHYSYDAFHFVEGYQFVRIFVKDPAGRTDRRTDVTLMDSTGRFIPIERLIREKLPPGGQVEILPGIRDGQFLFRFTRSLYQNGRQEPDGEYNALGMADVTGRIILPPHFMQLFFFEPEGRLQYAQQGRTNRTSAAGIEGYIDRTGVFRIIKGKAKGGF